MKNSFATRGMLLSVALVLAFGAHISAQPKADKKGKAAEKAKDVPAAVKGRLPQHFGKLELDDKQKQQIYVIQASYDKKIDKLEDELREAKAKRDSEIFDVLTKAQQKTLTDLKDPPKEAAKVKEDAKPKGK